jgi:4-hydroxybenzoate polyprenyltransferase
MTTKQQDLSLSARLWIYQSERFPVFKHGLLILVFSFCAVCLSSLLRKSPTWPSFQTSFTAFICLFMFFLQLRIADEFKDRENDARYRPERPVPRGLVTLQELKTVGIVAALIQLGLAALLDPILVVVLGVVWLYMALMTVEFFVPEWLKKHTFLYMISHMFIMPLVDLFATGCDLRKEILNPPVGLLWFLAVSFFNGIVIEIGRKTWSPTQERQGVESYSSEWGLGISLVVWLSAMLLSLFCACMVAKEIDFLFPVLATLLAILAVSAYLAASFYHSPTPKKSKLIDNASALWVALLYFILGILPMGKIIYG